MGLLAAFGLCGVDDAASSLSRAWKRRRMLTRLRIT
jgi:hypothetical protein